jgi:hypothetical protein
MREGRKEGREEERKKERKEERKKETIRIYNSDNINLTNSKKTL